MKTPEEIKKGLEYCRLGKPCVDCSYDRRDFPHCVARLMEDAVYIINQYEQRLAQAERERDAAVHDLHVLFSKDGHTCMICDVEKTEPGCMFDCDHQRKWRGVCEENSKEEQQ